MRRAPCHTPILTYCCVLLLAACASPATDTTTSGIEGQVFIGPMCPVMQAGTPCPDLPLQATLTVLDQDRRKVTQVQTDAQGNFKVGLKPGTYALIPESPDGFAHAGEQTVTVTHDTFTHVTITYDSGIR